jgi:hypothetical protein
VRIDPEPITPEEDQTHFCIERLTALKVPDDPETWASVETDLKAELTALGIEESLRACLLTEDADSAIAADRVNIAMNQTFDTVQAVFKRHKLVRKRTFNAVGKTNRNIQKAAPPCLRQLRLQASNARKDYCAQLRSDAPRDAVLAAKRRWNYLSSRCRSTSKAVKDKQCIEWRRMWDHLRRSAPRQLWATFWNYTREPTETPQCTPDQQWNHWATQGDVHESVWNDSVSSISDHWINDVLRKSRSCPPAPSEAEVDTARKRLRPGRSPGIDGIPADILRKLDCIVPLATLLFSVMLRFALYPQALGVALIRALLKPGKPKDQPESLRGIRLLSSFAAWLGQLFDQRARKLWQAGCEQFGFRQNTGCMEAVAVLLALIYSRTTQNRRLFVVFVDLRTAFPSLNRSILIWRMFHCGLGLGLCKMLLAIFDMTTSIPCVGHLVGDRFQESRGTREGAVESPHLFNIYISDLRRRLEETHPRLCKLFHVTIAILLYADDAALPADTLDDLLMSVKIFEGFCNDMKLYIATAKTHITVFHGDADNGIIYRDGSVWVDGQKTSIYIYGQEISAVPSFKYLGVWLAADAKACTHMDSRHVATQRSGNALAAGLSRLPAYSHSFLQYLWKTLVLPVPLYGIELFVWPDAEIMRFKTLQAALWKRLLKLGGRAPRDAVDSLMGSACCCTIEWRVRRASLLLRLLNAPVDTWQHIALLYFASTKHEWYVAAFTDLQTAIPGVSILCNFDTPSPYVCSTRLWRDGKWVSAQPFGPRTSSSASPYQDQNVRLFIKVTTQKLRTTLIREAESSRKERIIQRETVEPYAKTVALASHLKSSGPSPAAALNLVGPTCDRAAVSAWFSGDFFLGRYAGNYFAKQLLPTSARHLAELGSKGIDPSRVCLHCWHFNRKPILENESHILAECPQYDAQRRDFTLEIPEQLAAEWHAADPDDKPRLLYGSTDQKVWIALGRFLARVRQIRRRMRIDMQRSCELRGRQEFHVIKKRWRQQGKHVCRHGVFFDATPDACPCLQPPLEADWSEAVLMPALHHRLMCIVTDSFNRSEYQRLEVLQAEARRRNYF